MRGSSFIRATGVLALLVAAAGPGIATGRAATAAAAPSDFDGDGYADLAVGVPLEGAGGEAHAGVVNVLYGSQGGLTAAGDQLWLQASPGIRGTLEAGDRFGYALASGDFDRDGFADLVIGAPGESVGRIAYAGAVHVIYGSPNGLTATGDQLWTEAVVHAEPSDRDQFGLALAASDFDADGYADLAIGVPGEGLWAQLPVRTGAIAVLFGSATGLVAAGATMLDQSSFDVGGDPGDVWNLGGTLAAGDLDADGFNDLAIGVALDPLIGHPLQAGAVHVAFGGADGLSGSGGQRWSQDSPGIDGDVAASDTFGAALAIGDFDVDGFDDLAVGVPHDSFDGLPYGATHVIRGSMTGLTAAGAQYWHHQTPGIPYTTSGIAGTAGVWLLGAALEAADFDADGDADLAIGAPYALTGPRTGAVVVLEGATGGLTTSGGALWSENAPGVPGSGQTDDAFGRALGSADFDGDGYADLAIGIWSKDFKAAFGAGSVLVLRGGPAGITSGGARSWSQHTPGVRGTAEMRDEFGMSLTP